MSIFTKRLKEARRELNLSQEALGILAGIDEDSASARMNQYEKGKHEPDFTMVERIAKALNVPESYLYAKDDQAASMLKQLHRMNPSVRKKLIELIQQSILNIKE